MNYTGRFWIKRFLIFLAVSTLGVLLYLTNHKREWLIDLDSGGKKTRSRIVKNVIDTWNYLIEFYGISIGQITISSLYSLYESFSLLNFVLFLFKYVPTCSYMYKSVKNLHITSRERLMKTQMAIEDIQLQIQIVYTKMSMRECEYKERAEQLKREAKRPRTLRARVREVIAMDETLRRTLDRAAPCGGDPVLGNTESDEEREYITELLKEVKSDTVPVSDGQSRQMDCGEQLPSDIHDENSVYSSVSDDVKPECTVKIVKVTNVYKVAYLKHYIQQKRLRKATRHALLKKKIEAIQTLLEEWQKSLNRVLNTKIPIARTINMEAASEVAMSDRHSKPNLRDMSDSDTDLMANETNAYCDELNFNWTQNPYRPYQYEGLQEISVKEFYDPPDYNEDVKYAVPRPHHCESKTGLFILPEETSSQVGIEEIKSEHDSDYETDGRDLIAL